MLSFNHVFKFGATALAAFVLSACGSSGGGGDNPDNSPVNNHELNQSNTLVNNNVAQQQANKKTGTALLMIMVPFVVHQSMAIIQRASMLRESI